PGSSNSQRNNAKGTTRLGLLKIRERVVNCRRCARLVEYRERIAREKRKEFESWDYWGRPVPGFGNPDASLLIVGLAPAAHGGNRTGRVFTGDRSGDFLYNGLYKTGFANQPVSESLADGLVLKNAYVTAAVKCAPPDNKPAPEETSTCSVYLASEIDALKRLTVILCLGQFAFKAVASAIRKKYGLGPIRASFAHGKIIRLGPGVPSVICSYHPSPRNTQTGKLTNRMFLDVLRKAQREIGP
ncbi:MAG TPA: uracil-DNA glycosylase, partial [Candidatus Bathyarchaeia archaeon]|nr:uracil-DNA glycosylase [Candidatus Bathyarchaeia archaeon]